MHENKIIYNHASLSISFVPTQEDNGALLPLEELEKLSMSSMI